MRLRRLVVRALESTVGVDRSSRLRQRFDPWMPPDPFAHFPKPTMSRHGLLTKLHTILKPRTYLEIGIMNGESLALSRTRSIGVDPAYEITAKIQCDAQLMRTSSDEFFADASAVEHFAGTPLDFAFIDGMHLSEFALRDFINLEKLMTPAGVIVFDDMLPRNSLEAARVRRTRDWTGDVYKVADILVKHRPDLKLIPVNTAPTGTLVVVGLDPTSTVLEDRYDAVLPFCQSPDPQTIREEWLKRSAAVDATKFVQSDVWAEVVRLRSESADRAEFVEPFERLAKTDTI